jgi:lysophospholipase L1-like esterase
MPLQKAQSRWIQSRWVLTIVSGCIGVCMFSFEAHGTEQEQDAESSEEIAHHRPEGLSFFFDKLQDTKSQKGIITRIAWWGDSAIVGDGYTREVRKRLQARFGNGGPGFVPLAPGSDGFRRDGILLKHRGWEVHSVLLGLRDGGYYGYAGVASSSWGGATTTLTLRDEPIDQVHTFYRATPHSGRLKLMPSTEDPKAYLAHSTKTKEGEESTDQVWTLSYPQPTSRVTVRAGGDGLVRAFGIALERRSGGVVLDAMGILGMRARRWKRSVASHIARQVAMRNVDLLVVNFGGNERVDPGLTADRHEQELSETLARFQAGHPEAACLVVGPIAHGKDGHLVLDPALEVIYEAQRKVAKKNGCAFFDTVFAMGGDNAIRQFRKKRLIGRDLAHLNTAGHRLVGTLLADWLLNGYDALKNERPTGVERIPSPSPPAAQGAGSEIEKSK